MITSHPDTTWHGPGCCPRHALRPDLGSAPCDFDGTTPLEPEPKPEPEYGDEDYDYNRPWHPNLVRQARFGVG